MHWFFHEPPKREGLHLLFRFGVMIFLVFLSFQSPKRQSLMFFFNVVAGGGVEGSIFCVASIFSLRVGPLCFGWSVGYGWQLCSLKRLCKNDRDDMSKYTILCHIMHIDHLIAVMMGSWVDR